MGRNELVGGNWGQHDQNVAQYRRHAMHALSSISKPSRRCAFLHTMMPLNRARFIQINRRQAQTVIIHDLALTLGVGKSTRHGSQWLPQTVDADQIESLTLSPSILACKQR